MGWEIQSPFRYVGPKFSAEEVHKKIKHKFQCSISTDLGWRVEACMYVECIRTQKPGAALPPPLSNAIPGSATGLLLCMRAHGCTVQPDKDRISGYVCARFEYFFLEMHKLSTQIQFRCSVLSEVTTGNPPDN